MKQGPIDSLAVPRFAGIPSFFRLPILDDASQVDVAIFGVPFDGGQGYRSGSRFAPSRIRMISAIIPPFHPGFELSPYEYFRVADLGDCPVNPLDPRHSRALIQKWTAAIVAGGTMPLAVGGDHSISLPLLRAVAGKHGPVGLIHLDAHNDTGDRYWGRKYGSGTPFRRAIEEGLIRPDRWLQIGIHGSVYGEHDFDFDRRQGATCITLDRIADVGLKEVFERMADLWQTPCYVTIDVDGVDPAYAPGTTSPVPGGLTSREAIQIIRGLRAIKSVVGFDIVEVQPMYDVGDITSLLASQLIFEFLAARAKEMAGRGAAGLAQEPPLPA